MEKLIELMIYLAASYLILSAIGLVLGAIFFYYSYQRQKLELKEDIEVLHKAWNKRS